MKQTFVIEWKMRGRTLVEATDDRAAQAKFDKMDAQRLLRPRRISPYGHPDTSYEFKQLADPALKNEAA